MGTVMERPVYHYSAFGLLIESEIPLQELTGVKSDSFDVSICFGSVPDELAAPQERGYFYQSAAGEFLFRINGIASFYVSGGQRIVVEPSNPDDLSIARLYLLGTAMGVLLMQRGMAPMHGSTVVIDGLGVMLTGLSGAGKSTLAAALLRRGYPLVADDVSAMTQDEKGVCWVQPGYPQQKLDEASAVMTGVDTKGLRRIFDRNKFVVPVVKGFCPEPVRLAAVYEIAAGPCEEVSVTPMVGMERITALIENTYRVEFIRGLGLKVAHFRQCTAMARQAKVFRLSRPQGQESVEQQADAVVRHFQAVCRT